MNDEKFFKHSNAPLHRLEGRILLNPGERQEVDKSGRLQPLLKMLAWSLALTALLATLVTWGVNSRFGLLLLLLLR